MELLLANFTILVYSTQATLRVRTSELAADLILVNGTVITVVPARTIARTVAIKDGRIHAMGTGGLLLIAVSSVRLLLTGGDPASSPPASGLAGDRTFLHPILRNDGAVRPGFQA